MTQIGVELEGWPAQVSWAANTIANPLFCEQTEMLSDCSPRRRDRFVLLNPRNTLGLRSGNPFLTFRFEARYQPR